MPLLSLYFQLFLLLVLPTAVGIVLARRGVGQRISGLLFNWSYFFFNTAITVLAVWQADLANDAWMLPFIALSGWVLSILVARFGETMFQHNRKQRGSFLFTLCISNHGYTLLGIVAFVLFGEPGLAQATYAQFFIIPFLVFFCFPAARYYGFGAQPQRLLDTIRNNLLDSRNLVMVAMLVGLALNLANVERPALLDHAVRPLVYGGCIASCIAIGIGMRISRLGDYLRENMFSFVYRSTLYPAWFAGLAWLAGVSELDRNVLILFGIVPSAIFANMLAEFYNLDKDMTNAVYLVSTVLFLTAVLPVYILSVGV